METVGCWDSRGSLVCSLGTLARIREGLRTRRPGRAGPERLWSLLARSPRPGAAAGWEGPADGSKKPLTTAIVGLFKEQIRERSRSRGGLLYVAGGWVAVDRLRVTWWGHTGTASAAPYSARWLLPTLLLQGRPAAGNPSESRAARRLALPTPPSLLPSFIFPPPPCPVSQVIPSHPRGRRLTPRCFTAAHGSPLVVPVCFRWAYTPSRPSTVPPPTCCPSRVMAMGLLRRLSKERACASTAPLSMERVTRWRLWPLYTGSSWG